METYLKEINTVLGVVGSFVCTSDGSVVDHAAPERLGTDRLAEVARVAAQTYHALEASGLRITELDLTFERERFILKVLRGGFLGILCTRSINLPLLNITLNVAVKKISAELKGPKAPRAATPTPEPAPAPASPPPAAPVVTAPQAVTVEPVSTPPTRTVPPPEPQPLSQVLVETDKMPPPLYIELSQEVQRVLQDAKRYRLELRAMDSVAVWLCTSYARRMLKFPDKRELTFAGRSVQSNAFTLLFQHLGYKENARFNAFYGNRRQSFARADVELTVQIVIDNFAMYHRLDLSGCFAEQRATLPESFLLLTRLQLVEIDDNALGEICALLLEHDLGVGAERDKIDASHVTRVCGDDWGWFKTASMNLDRVLSFASSALGPADRSCVVERVQRLRSSMNSAPKSLRWQTRARLGETVRWYETPVEFKGTARPDMAMG